MVSTAHRQLAEVPGSLTQLHTILPSQHFGPRRKQAPEHRLMMAVLHDALECLRKHRGATGPHGRRLFDDAQRWFLADDTRWPYSFEGICGVLDLDANAVRQRLRVGSTERKGYRATRRPPGADYGPVETGYEGD